MLATLDVHTQMLEAIVSDQEKINTDVASIEADVASINTAMTAVAAEIASLKQTVPTLDTTGLDKAVTDLQTATAAVTASSDRPGSFFAG